MHAGMARYMSAVAYYDSSKAIRELGYSIVPLDQQITATYDWYRQNGIL